MSPDLTLIVRLRSQPRYVLVVLTALLSVPPSRLSLCATVSLHSRAQVAALEAECIGSRLQTLVLHMTAFTTVQSDQAPTQSMSGQSHAGGEEQGKPWPL